MGGRLRGDDVDQTVTRFRSLLNPIPGEEPGAAQHRAPQLLPERVKRSPLDWWPPDAVPNGTEDRLLIGVAVWSRYDLNLLDLVEDVVRAGRGPVVPVGVFDLDRLTPDDLNRLLPGLGPVHHPPVVGHWVGGRLARVACGFEARQFVAGLLGFDARLAIEQPAVTPR